MFGMDVITYSQIDTIVLDFPISLSLWNGGAQVSAIAATHTTEFLDPLPRTKNFLWPLVLAGRRVRGAGVCV